MSNRLDNLLWRHETGIEIDKDELIRELVIERQLNNDENKYLVAKLHEGHGELYAPIIDEVERVIVRPINDTKERVRPLQFWNYK